MKKLVLIFFSIIAFSIFSTNSTVTASDEIKNTLLTYQIKRFSNLKEVNTFMSKHKGATLVGYDRKTETRYSGQVDDAAIYEADEKYIVQYPR